MIDESLDDDAPTPGPVAIPTPREPTSQAVERVAMAIERSCCDSDEEFEEAWNGECRHNVRHNRRIEARAAIAAMREPTEAMKWSANQAFPDAPGEITCGELGARLWRAMIDTALADDQR